MSFKKFSCLGITILLATAANAETILFDFGNNDSNRGVSVANPDGNGNFWNSVWSGDFYSNVLDSSGNATAVDFGFSSATGTDYFNGPSGATQNPAAAVYDAVALGNLGVDEAVYDYYVSSTFQVQQLDPSKTYNLTFFGSHKFNNDNTTRYTVYTDGTFTTPVASADLLVGVGSAHNENSVATISGVAPQASNILYIGFAGANGGNGYLNAFQIEVVPEPNACLLAIMCGLGLVLRSRR